MSERRTILSRPRTRVYDCNYNIGEKYYKPTLDQLDRKYSGRPSTSSTTPTFTSRIKEEDDFPSLRKPVAEFDTPMMERRSRLNGDTRSLEDDLEEDIINSMNKLKALRVAKASSFDNEFSTLNGPSTSGIKKQRKLNITSKILDSVGINGRSQDALEEEVLKKRTVKIPSLFDEEPSGFTKWSKLKDASSFGNESAAELSAMARARQSKARLLDIENEIDAVAERGAARDRRLNNIKALIAGEDAASEGGESFKSRTFSSSKTTSKKVSF